VAIRLAIGLPLVALGLTGLLLTSIHGRQAKAFERAAGRIEGEVMGHVRSESGGQDHVLVRFVVDGRSVVGQAPSLDGSAYDRGQKVLVLYDHEDPEHIVLDEERYNAETPFLFWSAVVVGGLLPGIMGWWWAMRVRRVAAAEGPAFAMLASVADDRPRPWNRRRRWVTLHALDATADDHAPVGSYPLMVDTPLPLGHRAHAEVKGNVRDGGLVVARIDERIAWPGGRLRA
jgi:hypothetical protein